MQQYQQSDIEIVSLSKGNQFLRRAQTGFGISMGIITIAA